MGRSPSRPGPGRSRRNEKEEVGPKDRTSSSPSPPEAGGAPPLCYWPIWPSPPLDMTKPAAFAFWSRTKAWL